VALLRYTALRFALFLGTAVLLYLVGVKDLFVCALIGIFISGLVSLVLLRNVRSQIGASKDREPKAPWKSPLARISDRIEEAAVAEDAADEAARAQREQS
jgi:hypothetical protein